MGTIPKKQSVLERALTPADIELFVNAFSPFPEQTQTGNVYERSNQKEIVRVYVIDKPIKQPPLRVSDYPYEKIN